MHVIFITFYFIINALDLHHAILLEQFLGLVDMSHASDEEIVFYACMAAAAATSAYVEAFELAEDDHHAPTDRFVRPDIDYMQWLAEQEGQLSDGGDRLIYDNMRMPRAAVDALVDMAKPYISPRLDPALVVCTTLQWLATGASVRAQEALFRNRAYSTVHGYRMIGLDAILRGLVVNGFYGGDVNDPDRMAKSSRSFAEVDPALAKCIGAIDGTHIAIVVPSELSHRFRNRYAMNNVMNRNFHWTSTGIYTFLDRKQYTSTNVLGVVDHDGRFLAAYPGIEGCKR